MNYGGNYFEITKLTAVFPVIIRKGERFVVDPRLMLEFRPVDLLYIEKFRRPLRRPEVEPDMFDSFGSHDV